jgi:hypothetical protein
MIVPGQREGVDQPQAAAGLGESAVATQRGHDGPAVVGDLDQDPVGAGAQRNGDRPAFPARVAVLDIPSAARAEYGSAQRQRAERVLIEQPLHDQVPAVVGYGRSSSYAHARARIPVMPGALAAWPGVAGCRSPSKGVDPVVNATGRPG